MSRIARALAIGALGLAAPGPAGAAGPETVADPAQAVLAAERLPLAGTLIQIARDST